MKYRTLMQAFCLAVAAVFLFATVAGAQVSTSTITGTVTDAQNLVVAGAKVVAKNEATTVSYQTETTTGGTYSLSSLPPGLYTITVTHQGFKTFTSTKNVLTVGAPLVVDAQLVLGEVTEVVQVESSFQRLETSHSMLSGVVGRKEISELPLNGRNPLNLIILEPGLVQRTTNSAGSGTHVFGSRDRAHNITIDGIDANESSVPNPQSNIYRLNTDNVQEYRVVTLNATPEYGRNSGANVSIATRTGTNEYHGDMFYYHRNTSLNANEFFNKNAPIPQVRPTLLLHQYGVEGGGPVIKNKTFFFGGWQGNRIKQTQPISASFGVPTMYTSTLRGGIFRFFVPDPANPLVIDGVTVTRNSPLLVDPVTGQPRTGVQFCPTNTELRCIRTYNIITNDPASIGIDPTIAALVATLPLPNDFTVGDGLNFGGFNWNTPARFKGPNNIVRVDHTFNDRNNIFGRILWGSYNTTDGDLLNARPSVYPGFPPLGEVSRSHQNLALSYRHVFSPQLVNDFTVGYSRFQFFFSLLESQVARGVTPPPYAQECFGTSSFRTVDMPFCNTPHTARAVSNIQYIDNLSYVRGAHTFKSGLNFRFYRHNDSRGVPGGFNMAPTIVFDQSLRGVTANTAPGFAGGFTNLPATTGTGAINSSDNSNLRNAIVELVGIPARFQQVFQADLGADVYRADLFTLGTRAQQYNLYFQDEWKIRRDLTLTYGVRWEFNRPATDCCNRVFVPDRDILTPGAVTYVKSDSWWNRSNRNLFGPSVGLAWNPWADGKTVVRTGYRMAFDTLSTFQATSIGGKVPGSTKQCFTNVQGTSVPTGCQAINQNYRLPQLLAAFNPFTQALPTVAPSTQFSPTPQALGTAPGVGAFDPNLRVPTVHEWTLSVQRELPWKFVGQVGYVGKRGTHLYRAYDLNQIRTDQAGFLQSFLTAQNNVFLGCDPDGTVLGVSLVACAGATTPTLLLQLTGTGGGPSGCTTPSSTCSAFINNATVIGQLQRNGLGDLAARIDTLAFGTFSTLSQFGPHYFRPNAQFSDIFYFDSGGSSTYHGMIVQATRRFEKGLSFGFAYTLSKSIDDMSVDPVGAASGGGLSTTNSRTPTDVRNFRLDRSVSDFDNRHVIVMNYLYELPFGQGRKWGASAPGFLNHIIGGWSWGGIFTRQSGEPFTLNSGSRTVHNTKQSRAVIRGPIPNFDLKPSPSTRGPVLVRVSDLITNAADPNFNCRNVLDQSGTATTSFICIPPPGSEGSGRNSVRGPGFWNFDTSIIKNFGLTEQMKLQFRTEFFNVLNHANFENPRNASTGSPTLTSTVFGQTCCISSAVPASATVIAVGEPNRVIQFVVKLIF